MKHRRVVLFINESVLASGEHWTLHATARLHHQSKTIASDAGNAVSTLLELP
jgi:hypothetical protein